MDGGTEIEGRRWRDGDGGTEMELQRICLDGDQENTVILRRKGSGENREIQPILGRELRIMYRGIYILTVSDVYYRILTYSLLQAQIHYTTG